MKKISFRQLENLVRKLRVEYPHLNPFIYHQDSYIGIRIREIVINSNILDIIRSCFKSTLYFIERDTYNADFYLFSFHVTHLI